MAVSRKKSETQNISTRKLEKKIMDSTGAQCWCNFLVVLELVSNSRDLFFILAFLTDIVIVSHLRLFLHDIADKNASLAQDAHDHRLCSGRVS